MDVKKALDEIKKKAATQKPLRSVIVIANVRMGITSRSKSGNIQSPVVAVKNASNKKNLNVSSTATGRTLKSVGKGATKIVESRSKSTVTTRKHKG